MAETRAEETFQELLSQLLLIKDEVAFSELYDFTIEEYLYNREVFVTNCRNYASHIEQTVRDTGIAQTVGGGVGIASGAALVTGLILAPFTFGLSTGLTIAGAAGGVASAATSISATAIREGSVRKDKDRIKEELEAFEREDKIMGALMAGIQENVDNLQELMADPSVLQMMGDIATGIKTIGWNVVYGGVNLVSTINAVNFAKQIGSFIQADFYAMTGIAEGLTAPGLGLFGRTLITAGGTTAKVFSGVFAGLGIIAGISDVVFGALDIQRSTIANGYREFADTYEEQTESLIETINELMNMLPSE